jgi:hypothetical protein
MGRGLQEEESGRTHKEGYTVEERAKKGGGCPTYCLEGRESKEKKGGIEGKGRSRV